MLILVIVLLVLFGGIGVYSYRRPRPYNGYRFNLFRRRPRQVPPPQRPMEPMGRPMNNRPLNTMGAGPQMNNGPMNNPGGMGNREGQPNGGPRNNGPMGGSPNMSNRRPR